MHSVRINYMTDTLIQSADSRPNRTTDQEITNAIYQF